jgi:hypothetical protein
MTIKIEKKRIEPYRNVERRDVRAYVLALRDLKVGESFLWKLQSNDRMTILILSIVFDRKFITRKEGEMYRIARTI